MVGAKYSFCFSQGHRILKLHVLFSVVYGYPKYNDIRPEPNHIWVLLLLQGRGLNSGGLFFWLDMSIKLNCISTENHIFFDGRSLMSMG